MQLTGKVVLVTGAQQGIGRAMAREFAAVGADVAINWLDDDGAAQRVAHEVRTQGRRATLVQADVSRIEQVKAMVLAAQEGLGPIDTLGSSEAEIVEMARAIPLGLMAQPDEIARAAVFLASENAGFVTGQTLHVNGGSYLA